MRKKLFIPGPTEVRKDVLERMSAPLIGHRSKEASVLQRSISQKIQRLMYTSNAIILSTSSGSGLMEGAVRSCTRKRAAVFSCGAFGQRWHEIALANHVNADRFDVESGNAIRGEIVHKALKEGSYDLITVTHNETSTGIMNPLQEITEVMRNYPEVVFCVDAVSSLGGVKIPVDELGIDICLTSSQKCIGLPPGFSFCSISEKALQAAREVEYRGMYFDLLKLFEYIEKRDYQYPFTPSLSHMFALDYQLESILKEGLEVRFWRHRMMADRVREWAEEHFELFARKEYASNTVTCIKNTRKVNVKQLNDKLRERGFEISNGYGKLKDETFRIAHMGDMSLSEVDELLTVIDQLLEEEGKRNHD